MQHEKSFGEGRAQKMQGGATSLHSDIFTIAGTEVDLKKYKVQA